MAKAGEAGDDSLVLTLPEVAALPPTVEIGSHSRTHPHLTALSDSALDEELLGSRAVLEAATGRRIRDHAFPFGDHDARVDAAARRADYERCYEVLPSEARPGEAYVVGRINVDLDDWRIELGLKALGAYRWVAWWNRTRHAWAAGR